MIPTFIEKDRWPENRLKGSISECVIEQMFGEAGFKVYRFGYEAAIQHLKELNLKDHHVTRMIRSMPDFIAVDKKGNVFFIEVKYRSDWHIWENDREKLSWIYDYWKHVTLLIVSNKEPIFKIATMKEFMLTRKLNSLEDFRILKINKKIIEKYKRLIKKYLNHNKSIGRF